MAINAITISQPTIASTSASGITMQAISTSTGVYIDTDGIKSEKLAIIIARDATTEDASIVIESGSYSLESQGDLTVALSTGTNTYQSIVVETARFKNSSDDIVITCTGSTAVLSVGAVLLPG